MMFVLVSQNSFGNFSDFYLGKTYIYQGSYFPVTGRVEEAKNYKSRKIAENAIKTLSKKVGDTFTVKELD